MVTAQSSGTETQVQRRFKVRFPSQESYRAATALDVQRAKLPVTNEKRAYLSITLPPDQVGLRGAERGLDHQIKMFEKFGGEVVEDFQYDLEESIFPPFLDEPESFQQEGDLDDVLDLINAREAWERARGENVTIAVVDTGVDGSRPEFPVAKRRGAWQPAGETPWTDWQGHGTMCACIAAGSRSSGGLFDGVAPAADLIACKTHFFDSELTAIYDYLIAQVEDDPALRLVITNSFGIKTGLPPAVAPGSDFPDALDEVLGLGVTVCFSAGNNHERVGGGASDCHPTSIWLHKCREDVMAVGTCDLAGSMWFYSSRGPGQRHGDPGADRKPDVTAPTPRNGRIVYGAGVEVLPHGWGTSGACPQVAGLAALLLSADGSLSSRQVHDLIRRGAVPLGHAEDCEGAGRIDCSASIALV